MKMPEIPTDSFTDYQKIIYDELVSIAITGRFWLSTFESVNRFNQKLKERTAPRKVRKAFRKLTTKQENEVAAAFAYWRSINE